MENEEKQSLENPGVSASSDNSSFGAGNVSGGDNLEKIEGVENSGLLTSGEDGAAGGGMSQNNPDEGTASEKYDNFASGAEKKISESGVVGMSYSNDFIEKKGLGSVLSGPKGKSFMVVGALVVIAVFFVAAYYLLGYLTGEKTGLVPNEDGKVIVKSAVDKMSEIKSYDYSGVINFDFDLQEDTLYSQNKIVADYGLTDSGSVETADDGSMNMYGKYNLTGKYNGGSGDDKTFSAGLELALMDRMIYAKLNELDLSDAGIYDETSAKQMDAALEVFKNNWYYVSMDEYANSNSGENDLGFEGAEIWESMNIGNKIKDYSLLQYSSDLGDENIGGVDTYHYSIKLDVEEAARFMIDIMKEAAEKSGETEAQDFSQYLEENAENVENTKEALNFVMNNINSEVWIGKEDGLIHRFKITGYFDEQFVKDFAKTMSEDGAYNDEDMGMLLDANFEVDYTFSNFGGAKVNKPQDAKDLKKVMEGAFANMGFSNSSMVSEVDTDSDGLSDAAESFYGSDINKPDTDGDGYKDGTEVDNGYDPIVAGSAKLDFDKLLGN